MDLPVHQEHPVSDDADSDRTIPLPGPELAWVWGPLSCATISSRHSLPVGSPRISSPKSPDTSHTLARVRRSLSRAGLLRGVEDCSNPTLGENESSAPRPASCPVTADMCRLECSAAIRPPVGDKDHSLLTRRDR